MAIVTFVIRGQSLWLILTGIRLLILRIYKQCSHLHLDRYLSKMYRTGALVRKERFVNAISSDRCGFSELCGSRAINLVLFI